MESTLQKKMVIEGNFSRPYSPLTTTSSILGETSKQEGSEADLIAVTLPQHLEESAISPLSVVIISKKAKKITLLRYLLSKIVYETEKVAVRDILTLFQCILEVQDLAQRDPNFNEKFGLALEATSSLLKGVRFRKFDPKTLNALRKAILNVPEGFLYPQRNLSSVAMKVEGLYSLTIYRQLGKRTKLLPPKLYVGKGYNDKGTARNPAFDGSPSWQEVAMGVLFDEK